MTRKHSFLELQLPPPPPPPPPTPTPTRPPKTGELSQLTEAKLPCRHNKWFGVFNRVLQCCRPRVCVPPSFSPHTFVYRLLSRLVRSVTMLSDTVHLDRLPIPPPPPPTLPSPHPHPPLRGWVGAILLQKSETE